MDSLGCHRRNTVFDCHGEKDHEKTKNRHQSEAFTNVFRETFFEDKEGYDDAYMVD